MYVADTGNMRVLVYDENGAFLSQIGLGGMDDGEFEEPVGLAIDRDGRLYVADTWNQRIQGFTPSLDGTYFLPTLQWDVNAWYGQSLDNKPFISVGGIEQHVFITDPEGYRIIEFTSDGKFVRTWGDFGDGPAEIGLAAGVTIYDAGLVWVTDAGNNRILQYRLP